MLLSGKWTNHKGRSRRFTNPDELEEQRKREEQERRWKSNRGDDESSSEEETPATKGDKSNSEDESESDSESDEDSDDVSFDLGCSSRSFLLFFFYLTMII